MKSTSLVPLVKARLACLAAQGFPPRVRGSVVSTLENEGFVRTLGGVDAYLAIRARVPGASRESVDRAIAEGRVRVVPSVRGCIYLVARRDVPWALRAADLLSRARIVKENTRAGVRRGEIEKVADETAALLRERGPLTTDGIRRSLPAGVLRSLGDAGKKVGVSSALPTALRFLEFDGTIERVPEGNRLDTERYVWRATLDSPFEDAALPDDPRALWARLAQVFFRAAGLATLKDFTAWAGIPQRDARAAVDGAALAPVTVEGASEPFLVQDDRKDALFRAAGAGEAAALLPFEDNVVALRGGPRFLVDPRHHGYSVRVWGSSKKRTTTLGEAKHLSYRCAVAEGRIVGFWEFDPDRKEVVLSIFDAVKAATRSRLRDLAADLGRFLRDELGHAKSFSLDTEDDLRERAASLRTLVR